MRTTRTYWVPLAATILCAGIAQIQINAQTAQAAWTDEITRQIVSEREQYTGRIPVIAYTRYLDQLETVKQAMARGDLSTIQSELTRLIVMLAAKEGGIADASAISLLVQVDRVTPSDFVDDTARPLLLQVRALVLDRDEGIAEHPMDGHHGTTVQLSASFLRKLNPTHIGKGFPIMMIALGISAAILLATVIAVGAKKTRLQYRQDAATATDGKASQKQAA